MLPSYWPVNAVQRPSGRGAVGFGAVGTGEPDRVAAVARPAFPRSPLPLLTAAAAGAGQTAAS